LQCETLGVSPALGEPPLPPELQPRQASRARGLGKRDRQSGRCEPGIAAEHDGEIHHRQQAGEEPGERIAGQLRAHLLHAHHPVGEIPRREAFEEAGRQPQHPVEQGRLGVQVQPAFQLQDQDRANDIHRRASQGRRRQA
jgi:hypothetical protein